MSEQTTEIWQWLHESLQRLKQRGRDEPGLTWEERLPDFLGSLGVASVDDHPVLRLLADDVARLGTEEERTAFLADDALDTHAYALVEQVVAEFGEHTDEQADQQGAERPTLEQVVDQAVREVALPVLTEVAASRPDLLSGVPTADLAETVGRLLATRLATA